MGKWKSECLVTTFSCVYSTVYNKLYEGLTDGKRECQCPVGKKEFYHFLPFIIKQKHTLHF